MEFSPDILEAFGQTGDWSLLPGGQNTSVKAGNVVLKPVEDIAHADWLSEVLVRLKTNGYRVSKPIQSKYGNFSYNGWTCCHYEKGLEIKGAVQEKLAVSHLLHHDLKAIVCDDFPVATHHWAMAHRVAWQKEPLPADLPKEAFECLKRLLQQVKLEDRYEKQLIHADLAGNILFDTDLGPLIIDFSPTVAPVAYAEAILVGDSIAWQGAPVTTLQLLPQTAYYQEMLWRAVIFRLVVAALFSTESANLFHQSLFSFQPVINALSVPEKVNLSPERT